MFAEFLNRDKFYQKYMQLLATRMAIGNVEMEKQNEGDISDYYLDIYNNIEAFKHLMELKKEKVGPYDIAEVAYLVNSGEYEGFRKTQVSVRKAKKFFPIEAKEVIPKMYSIIDNYYNIWNILPTYEREARLHIELVRTQPFEDGNKRTSKILTNYNLCKQNKAPIIISAKDTDRYFGYIDDYDVEGFTKFIENKSKEELQVMMNLYTLVCGDDMIVEAKNDKDSIVNAYQKQYTINPK